MFTQSKRHHVHHEAKPSRFDQYVSGNKIDLSQRNIHDADMPELVNYLSQHPAIKIVDLRLNYITATGATTLSKCKTISELDISANYIGSQGAKALAKNPLLTTLMMRDNQIKIDAIAILAKTKTIKKLGINRNEFNNEVAQLFAKNKKIAVLEADYHYISYQYREPLLNRIANNHVFQFARDKAHERTRIKHSILIASLRSTRTNSFKDSIIPVVEHVMLSYTDVPLNARQINQKFLNSRFFKSNVGELPTHEQNKASIKYRKGR